jgi:hypothetical protein
VRFDVILEGMGGELARERVKINEAETDDLGAAVDDAASHIIEGFVLSVGDTIRLVEIEEKSRGRSLCGICDDLACEAPNDHSR